MADSLIENRKLRRVAAVKLTSMHDAFRFLSPLFCSSALCPLLPPLLAPMIAALAHMFAAFADMVAAWAHMFAASLKIFAALARLPRT